MIDTIGPENKFSFEFHFVRYVIVIHKYDNTQYDKGLLFKSVAFEMTSIEGNEAEAVIKEISHDPKEFLLY